MNNNENAVSTTNSVPTPDMPIPIPMQLGCFRFEEEGGRIRCNYIYPEIAKSSKTEIVIRPTLGNRGTIFARYRVGCLSTENLIMPEVEDVDILVENKVVIVTFTDGTSEKAVLTGSDTFSLEQGVSICITKKLLSDKSNGNGSNLYNKIIDRAMKKYKKIQNDKKKTEEQKKVAEAKYQKTVAKKAAKRAKREAAAREEKINIQKEAIIRAMKELNSSPADVSV